MIDSSLDTVEKVLQYLDEHGRADTARDIAEHQALFEEDDPPIVVESLRSMAEFMLLHPQLRMPSVWSTPDAGLMGLEWHIENGSDPSGLWGHTGIVTLVFWASGLVRFVALSGSGELGDYRLQTTGTTTREYVLRSLGEFTDKICEAEYVA